MRGIKRREGRRCGEMEKKLLQRKEAIDTKGESEGGQRER